MSDDPAPEREPTATAPGRPSSWLRVARDVHGLRTGLVNLYFLGLPGAAASWVLVDAGMRGYAGAIERAAARLFGTGQPPRAVVLTHGHFDHVGSLPALLRRWRVPVYAHRDELPFLNDRRPYPPPDPQVGGMMARLSVLYPRRGAALPGPVIHLPDDGSVPGAPGWRWVATPGHTPGHVSLHRPADAVVIAGDAVVTTRQERVGWVWRQRPEVRPPPAYFTPDWHQAHASIQRLLELEPSVMAPGHGLPMPVATLRPALDDLVRDFAQQGLPVRGHYAATTWP